MVHSTEALKQEKGYEAKKLTAKSPNKTCTLCDLSYHIQKSVLQLSAE